LNEDEGEDGEGDTERNTSAGTITSPSARKSRKSQSRAEELTSDE